MTGAFRLIDLAPLDVRHHAVALGEVYRRAFKVDSDERITRFIDNSLIQHTGYDGYRCVAAVDDGDRILGFVYGYESRPGRWWHDTVAPTMRAGGYGDWLSDAFEFVEFAVDPISQRRGIGGHLHDEIIGHVSSARSLLSTDAGMNLAHEMYLRRGWIDLVSDFRYPGGGSLAVLMGLDLVAWRAQRRQPD